MSQTQVLISKIALMALVMLVGFAARRIGRARGRSLVDEPLTAALSRLITDVTLPALIFSQMLATVDADSARQFAVIPLLAIVVLLTGQFLGIGAWRVFCPPPQARTFIFVIAIANWIYFPLPIVEELYGSAGVRAVLLFNAGSLIYVWSVGVATLTGRVDRSALLSLVQHPGLLATLAGVALALLGVTAPNLTSGGGTLAAVARPVLDALALLGGLTVPLALLVTGAQMGGLSVRGQQPWGALGGALLLRLLAAPLLVIGVLWVAKSLGIHLPEPVPMVVVIIAAMPTGLSCSVMAQRFGGDTPLAARSIVYGTLASIVTVPLVFALAQAVL